MTTAKVGNAYKLNKIHKQFFNSA